MADNENPIVGPLYVDRDSPVGVSTDAFGRRAIHTKIGNTVVEPIPVTITSGIVGAVIVIPNQISAVVSSSTVTIISYTVLPSQQFQVLSLTATGTGDGIYQVLINSVFQEEQRTAWTDRNAFFTLAGFVLNAGDIIILQVTNNNANSENYSGTLIGTVA